MTEQILNEAIRLDRIRQSLIQKIEILNKYNNSCYSHNIKVEISDVRFNVPKHVQDVIYALTIDVYNKDLEMIENQIKEL